MKYIAIALLALLVAALNLNAAPENPRRALARSVPPGAFHAKLLHRLPDTNTLHLALSLPVRNQAALDETLRQLYDPSSPRYHQWLTSAEFTETFGPTPEDVQKVTRFAQRYGLTVNEIHANRMIVDVSGPIARIENAFQIKMAVYQHPSENRTYFGPDVEPTVDTNTPILDVSGLDNFILPRSLHVRTELEQTTNFATGSGPGGTYRGTDLRHAYAPGVVLDGTGQSIGLFQLGSVCYPDDLTAYTTASGIAPIDITNVLINGFSSTPSGDTGEQSLDVEVSHSMAPGAKIYFYIASSAIDVWNRIASDNLCKQISSSWSVSPPPSTMNQVLQQMAAQGQSVFQASGDSGFEATPFGWMDNANLTLVGGAVLTTSGAGGAYASETGWSGSGGIISPNFSIPTWQQGIDMTANQGSTTQRNGPDVAAESTSLWTVWHVNNAQTSGGIGGTSASSPMWAGFLALVNQQAVANNRSTIGFINPLVYSILKGTGSATYASAFHDITSGSNGKPAVTGYDLVTGVGSPVGQATINALAGPPDDLQITPVSGFTFSIPPGIPYDPGSLTFTLTNIGASSLNWSLSNTSSWFNVSVTSGALTPGGAASVVTLTLNLSVVTNLNLGTYTANYAFTNQSSGLVQKRGVQLIVSPAAFPIAASGYNASVIVPNNATVGNPQAVSFDASGMAFFQSGANTNSQFSGGGVLLGFPRDGKFVSQLDAATTFQFQPYGGSANVLLMGSTHPSSGTLTFTPPRAYNSLAILVSSGNGGADGTYVVHFANGASSPAMSFHAQDWFNVTANVALNGFGRISVNSLATQDNGSSNPNLYQTTLDLAALGYNQPVSSITFTKPSASFQTGVFAVSGAPMQPQTAITTQPQNVTNNNPLANSTLSVVAMGAPDLHYQWFSGTPGNSTLLAGQTSPTLTFTAPVQTTQAGNYFVVVTNTYNAVTSSVAALVVFRAPQIVQQPGPTNLTLFAGRTLNLSVSANAAVPVNYYWQTNNVKLPGATSSSLVIPNLQLTHSGNYSLIVSNSFGMVTSAVVSLTVISPTYPLAQQVLADNPIGYWPLSELTGTVAHDYATGKNGIYNSTLLGQPGYNLIDTHKAARFGALASVNSYAGTIPIDFATNTSAAFSVEAWVKGATPSTDAGIISKGTGSGGEQFNLDCGAGGHAFRFFVRDAKGNAHLANSSVTPNNQWHHVVGICDQPNGLVVLYVDGVSNASSTISAGSGILASTNFVSLGSRQGGTTTYNNQFIGTMQDVAIYNYALSPSQVLTHYKTASNRSPVFAANPFTEPAANAGIYYSTSIAASASDPNGDTVIYAKVSGPTWLNVATSGLIYGTPANTDANTNTFIVSARDAAGLSSTAPLFIYVNGSPNFTLNPLTLPVVDAGQPVSGTLATNATDPNPGDTLTFAKLSGPAWLSVAGNGALSGAPANADANTNAFQVTVTDSTLTSTGIVYIYVNGAPAFNNNPFSKAPIAAGQPYAGSLAADASDPNPADSLTFAKLSGPAWLSVASDGTLSGTPLSANVGTNMFLVKVNDPRNLSAQATMNIAVDPSAIVASLSVQGTNLLLNWSGGIAPYQVQVNTNLSGTNWQDWGNLISDTNTLLTPDKSQEFYRIKGQ
jgi:subtilase family serine protease